MAILGKSLNQYPEKKAVSIHDIAEILMIRISGPINPKLCLQEFHSYDFIAAVVPVELDDVSAMIGMVDNS